MKNRRMGVHAYIIYGFPSGGRKIFRLEERFLSIWLRRNWIVSW
jgi:hypothetical protein